MRGYIGRALFELLFINGIQLVTRVRNNMRNMLMSAEDKILLRKRAVIETVNDELKNIAQIEHSRHRSFNNFIVNILSAIAAYCFFPKKPLSMSHLSMTNNLSFSDAYFELTFYKELERLLKLSDINMSVDKVLELAKTIVTIQITVSIR